MSEAAAEGPKSVMRHITGADSKGRPRVGVLALQGDFGAHREALAEWSVAAVEVKSASDLDELDGLILPGGESTTMLKLMEGTALASKLIALTQAGTPVLATCAGVILLAREVRHPAQESLGVLDVTVERNAYGRQIDSAVVTLDVEDRDALGDSQIEGVFIRAPRIAELGPGVRVLARRGRDPVLVQQGRVLAATFHPELSTNSPVINLFVRGLGNGQ